MPAIGFSCVPYPTTAIDVARINKFSASALLSCSYNRYAPAEGEMPSLAPPPGFPYKSDPDNDLIKLPAGLYMDASGGDLL